MSDANYTQEEDRRQVSEMTLAQRDYKNLTILSNGIQLGADTIAKISGNEIADGVDGQPLSRDELLRTMAAKIQSYIRSE